MTILLTQTERLFARLPEALAKAGIVATHETGLSATGDPSLLLWNLTPQWRETGTDVYGLLLVVHADELSLSVIQRQEGDAPLLLATFVGRVDMLIDGMYALKTNQPNIAQLLPPHTYRVVADTLRAWAKQYFPNVKNAQQRKRRMRRAYLKRVAHRAAKPNRMKT